MLEIGASQFRLEVPAMPREELRSYSMGLFDDWDKRLQADFALKDYSLRLEIEEGSLDVLALIGGTLAALYTGIATYPSFLEGLEKIRTQARVANDHLVQRAAEPFTMLNLKPRVTRRSGVPGQLQRLFLRVKRRDIDVEEAMREAERLLGADAATSPDFMRRLATSLAEVPRYPEQLFLPMELPEQEELPAERKREPATRAPTIAPPAHNQLRIEVWRDHVTGNREVRIVEL